MLKSCNWLSLPETTDSQQRLQTVIIAPRSFCFSRGHQNWGCSRTPVTTLVALCLSNRCIYSSFSGNLPSIFWIWSWFSSTLLSLSFKTLSTPCYSFSWFNWVSRKSYHNHHSNRWQWKQLYRDRRYPKLGFVRYILSISRNNYKYTIF